MTTEFSLGNFYTCNEYNSYMALEKFIRNSILGQKIYFDIWSIKPKPNHRSIPEHSKNRYEFKYSVWNMINITICEKNDDIIWKPC